MPVRPNDRADARTADDGRPPYSPQGARVRSAIELASGVDELRLILVTALGDRYRVKVTEHGSVVGLWWR